MTQELMRYTVAMIKPDAVEARVIGPIISEAEKVGLRVLRMNTLVLSVDQARALYAEHEAKSFFAELIAFTVSGPVVAMLLGGVEAIAVWRALMGHSNPLKAESGTLRSRFGSQGPANAVHGSDSAVVRESHIFFDERELAVALLAREVCCELVYRHRSRWNSEHPNRALMLRSIAPRAIVERARPEMLLWDKDALRSAASTVVDDLASVLEDKDTERIL